MHKSQFMFVYLFRYASKTKTTEPNPSKFCLLPKGTPSTVSVGVANLGEGVQGD